MACFVATISVTLTLSINEEDLMLTISGDDLGDGDVLGNCDDNDCYLLKVLDYQRC